MLARRPHPCAYLLICLAFWGAAVAWPAAAGSASDGASADPDLDVKPIDEKSLRQAIEGSKGKVVLVNFWATWCDPCREEFPALVQLYGKYKGRGLEVFSVSVDDMDSMAQVKEFLRGQRTPFAAFIKNVKNDEAFINSVDPDWSGAVPATFIYDRHGKLVRKMIGERTLAEFESAILPLF